MLRYVKILLRTTITKIARLQSDRNYLSYLYQHRLGKKLNWDDPVGFMEKITYLKLKNKSDNRIKLFADKYSLRKMLKSLELDAYQVPLRAVYFNYHDFKDDLESGQIQPNCYVKLSNDCGSSINFNGKNISSVLKKIRKSLSIQKSFIKRTCEYQYETKTVILVEENLDKGKLYDVKVFLSGNKVLQIMCSQGKNLLFCDEVLNPLTVRLRTSVRGDLHPVMKELPQVEATKMLEHINIIKDRFGEFEFCRVDMITNISCDNVYINEVTFSPSSGLKLFEPESHDLLLGSMLKFKNG